MVRPLLEALTARWRALLGGALTGVYVHGSLAFGCFHPATGDVDLLVVVERELTLHERCGLIRAVLETEALAPPKGVEMSALRRDACRPFVYPTPYEAHYSITHRAACLSDLAGHCRALRGTDADLAAHITVLHEVGYPFFGPPVEEIFAPVPREAYLDSMLRDVAEADAAREPVYALLNLCRVLAFCRGGYVFSKQEGGLWALDALPARFAPTVRQALRRYADGRSPVDRAQAVHCCAELRAYLTI